MVTASRLAIYTGRALLLPFVGAGIATTLVYPFVASPLFDGTSLEGRCRQLRTKSVKVVQDLFDKVVNGRSPRRFNTLDAARSRELRRERAELPENLVRIAYVVAGLPTLLSLPFLLAYLPRLRRYTARLLLGVVACEGAAAALTHLPRLNGTYTGRQAAKVHSFFSTAIRGAPKALRRFGRFFNASTPFPFHHTPTVRGHLTSDIPVQEFRSAFRSWTTASRENATNRPSEQPSTSRWGDWLGSKPQPLVSGWDYVEVTKRLLYFQANYPRGSGAGLDAQIYYQIRLKILWNCLHKEPSPDYASVGDMNSHMQAQLEAAATDSHGGGRCLGVQQALLEICRQKERFLTAEELCAAEEEVAFQSRVARGQTSQFYYLKLVNDQNYISDICNRARRYNRSNNDIHQMADHVLAIRDLAVREAKKIRRLAFIEQDAPVPDPVDITTSLETRRWLNGLPNTFTYAAINTVSGADGHAMLALIDKGNNRYLFGDVNHGYWEFSSQERLLELFDYYRAKLAHFGSLTAVAKTVQD